MFTVNRNPTVRDLKWFAVAMMLGIPAMLGALLYVLYLRHGAMSGRLTVAATSLSAFAIGLGLVALGSREIGRKLYIGWMTLTLPIGLIMSTLALSVIYLVFLPVFSVLVRRRDPLRKKLGGPTYWEEYAAHEPTLDRMRRPF